MTTRKARAGVAWEAPPSPPPGKPDWNKVAAELRRHPGDWMLVYENGPSSWGVAVQIGHVAAMAEGFEFRTANNTRPDGGPRTCTFYARYQPKERVN